MSNSIIQRGGSWYLRRRVPKRYASIEARSQIWKSLHTDSRSVAASKAEKVWLELVEGWEAKLAGRSSDAAERFRAAQALADVRGFRFLSAEDVAKQPLEDILARIASIPIVDGTPDRVEAAALLGAADEPAVMLSDLVAHVEPLAAADNRHKNQNQMRIWRTPRQRAVTNLKAAIGGDLPVAELTALHAKKHRRWWEKKVAAGEAKAQTANKDFNYLSGMLARFYEDLDYDDPPRPYLGVRIKDKFSTRTRKDEVPVGWILEKWLKPEAFEGLNAQARDILLISLETGCRQSEIHDLPASAFHLKGDQPYLSISHVAPSEGSEGREIKNMQSARDVPLVGLALAAARRNPEGFPRYRGKASYSAAVNKYLRTHKLVPEGVTAGGLRHTWETRLKTAGIATDDRGEMMGHSLKARRGRETYGDGLTLSAKFDIVRKVAFPVPAHLA